MLLSLDQVLSPAVLADFLFGVYYELDQHQLMQILEETDKGLWVEARRIRAESAQEHSHHPRNTSSFADNLRKPRASSVSGDQSPTFEGQQQAKKRTQSQDKFDVGHRTARTAHPGERLGVPTQQRRTSKSPLPRLDLSAEKKSPNAKPKKKKKSGSQIRQSRTEHALPSLDLTHMDDEGVDDLRPSRSSSLLTSRGIQDALRVFKSGGTRRKDEPATNTASSVSFRQELVANVLKAWLSLPHVWFIHHSVRAEMGRFAAAARQDAGDNASHPGFQIEHAFKRMEAFLEANRNSHRSSVLLATVNALPGVVTTDSSVPISLLSLKPDLFAQTLTQLESELIGQIRVDALVQHAVHKHIPPPGFASPVAASIRWFNRFGRRCSTEILLAPTCSMRAEIISFLIDIGYECKELHNFNAVFEIVAALSLSSVTRLSQSWELVPSKAKDRFDHLKALVESDQSFATYRKALSAASPPRLPYLGRELADLTFISDGNRTFIDNKVNVAKLTMMSRVLSGYLRNHSDEYSLKVDPTCEAWLLRSYVPWSEKELFILSRVRERRKPVKSSTTGSMRGVPAPSASPLSASTGSGEPSGALLDAQCLNAGWLPTASSFVHQLALNQADLKRFYEDSPPKKFTPGTVICEPSDSSISLCLVLSGTVGIIVPQASLSICRTLHRGDFFGESLLFGRPKSAVKLVAETSCLLQSLSLASFRAILASEPNLTIRLAHMLAERAAKWLRDDERRLVKETDPLMDSPHVVSTPRGSNSMSSLSEHHLVFLNTFEKAYGAIRARFECSSAIGKHSRKSGLFVSSSSHCSFAGSDMELQWTLQYSKITDVDVHKKRHKVSLLTEDGSSYSLKFSSDALSALEIIIQLWRSLKKSSRKQADGDLDLNSSESADDLAHIGFSGNLSGGVDDPSKPCLAPLSESDLEFLFRAAETVSYSANRCIIPAGHSSDDLFEVLTGECVIRYPAELEGGSEPTIALKEGALFGASSFLSSSSRTSEVCASPGGPVRVRVVHGYFLRCLFNLRPLLGARFFCTLYTRTMSLIGSVQELNAVLERGSPRSRRSAPRHALESKHGKKQGNSHKHHHHHHSKELQKKKKKKKQSSKIKSTPLTPSS